jgi:hypothetical protein
MSGPGRIHPHDYSYDPSCFDRPPDLAAEVLYVVGGFTAILLRLTRSRRSSPPNAPLRPSSLTGIFIGSTRSLVGSWTSRDVWVHTVASAGALPKLSCM